MKTRIVILMTALLMIVSASAFAQKRESKKAPYGEVTFVTNLHCEKCVKKCNATLPYEKGIIDCKIDLNSKTIYFKFDMSKTSPEKLAKAIERLGYTASKIETVPESK
ncbi:MAG: heavy-metal-associated domain-containing protein [Bacteroidales bacterium]|nr:heavy-metal-associated domain-containing protein [Bacteroidales bacterium]